MSGKQNRKAAALRVLKARVVLRAMTGLAPFSTDPILDLLWVAVHQLWQSLKKDQPIIVELPRGDRFEACTVRRNHNVSWQTYFVPVDLLPEHLRCRFGDNPRHVLAVLRAIERATELQTSRWEKRDLSQKGSQWIL